MRVQHIELSKCRPESPYLEFHSERRLHERQLFHVDIAFLDIGAEFPRCFRLQRHDQDAVGIRIYRHAHVNLRLAHVDVVVNALAVRVKHVLTLGAAHEIADDRNRRIQRTRRGGRRCRLRGRDIGGLRRNLKHLRLDLLQLTFKRLNPLLVIRLQGVNLRFQRIHIRGRERLCKTATV